MITNSTGVSAVSTSSPRRLRWRFWLGSLAVLGATAFQATAAAPLPSVRTGSVDQFLTGLEEAEVVGLVIVRSAEIRWVVLEDGDHLPVRLLTCEMKEAFRGNDVWPSGTTQVVTQLDYSNMLTQEIAPPALGGRQYAVWLRRMAEGQEMPAVSTWMAFPQGVLLVRGSGEQAFVYWAGERFQLSELREKVASRVLLPLDQIADPSGRLEVARARVGRREYGDPRGFVHGLALAVQDPEGQIAQGSPTRNRARGGRSIHPHRLWYESLALLRDAGRDRVLQQPAVEALEPLVADARPKVRLAVALALVDLGSDAGRQALLKGYQQDSGRVSADPKDDTIFPGRYPYDESSVTACAHALARLGDRRGLEHASVDVRLATAEALPIAPNDEELVGVLRALAVELEPDLAKLEASGKLAEPRERGNFTVRFPSAWLRTRRLLAALGDDDSLRRLIDAYLLDAKTYPPEERSVVPTQRAITWSQGPSPSRSVRDVDDDRSRLLARLERLYADDPRWNGPEFAQLRSYLNPTADSSVTRRAPEAPTPGEIRERLSSSDPARRAEGLAAAGFHDLTEFYGRVVEVALHGAGIERRAATYALGFFRRQTDPAVLRALMADPDLDIQFAALEIATRRDPGAYAATAMSLARRIVSAAETKEAEKNFERKAQLRHLPSYLARFATASGWPAPILRGLADPDPKIRALVCTALGMGGVPEVGSRLVPLARDRDAQVARTARWALERIGRN